MWINSPAEMAAAVKRYRKQKGLSQKQLAELVGIKQTTVSAFENRPSSTKLETLYRILAATGIKLKIDALNFDQIETNDESW